MKKNFLYIIAFLSVLVACTEEKIEVGTPLTGQEVTFSVSMGNGKTNSRTIYGDAVLDDNKVETAYKVNWVDGDNITVYGTTCSVRQANYKVNPGKDTNGNNSNYASSLEKTGDAGVQWGKEEDSDFIAVYPAVDEDAFYMHVDVDVDGKEYETGNVSVYPSIRQTQTNNFKLVGNTWIGTPYQESTETMVDALMYAWTPGVNSKNTDTGGVVDLNFKPFSTVLKFTLNGWDVVEGTLDLPFSIQTITIKSPEAPIAGSCEFYFEKGKNIPEVNGGEYYDVIIQPKSLVVNKNQKIEFNVFTIPHASNMSKESVWVVVVEGVLGGDWVSKEFHITPSNEQELNPGEIHKINIPTLPLEGNPIELTDYRATWMKYIPRNVYLSELSLPGAWYCTDAAYQGDKSLDDLYNAGVRAFNIDCRVTLKKSKGDWDDNELSDCNLVCSGSESVDLLNSSIDTEGKLVSQAVKDLITLAQSKKVNGIANEYIAIIFTFAEKPMTNTGSRNTRIFGTTDPEDISSMLYDVLNQNEIKPYVYTNITDKTTIGDILSSGKNVIVKINHSNENFNSSTNPQFRMLSGIMASYAPMAMNTGYGAKDGSFSENTTLYFDQRRYPNITTLASDFYAFKHESYIYNGNVAETNGMTYHYCQAQKTFKTTGTPTLAQRKAAIDDVLSQAKTVYDQSNHNALFQLGIGGMADSNWDGKSDTNTQQDLAAELNPYIQTKIESMLNNGTVSPLGFVLMNYCMSYQDLLDDILMFNTNMTLNNTGIEKDKWPADCGGNPYTTEEGGSAGES